MSETDLVLVLGTSLAGMSSDIICHEPSDRYVNKSQGLGSVIISMQQTPHDEKCTLRIFAPLDKVFELLATEMALADIHTCTLLKDDRDIFMVPYTKVGKLIDKNNIKEASLPMLTLDLSLGSRVMQNSGHFRGALGYVRGRNEDGHWLIEFDEVDKVDGCISVNTVLKLFGTYLVVLLMMFICEGSLCIHIVLHVGVWWGGTLENGEVSIMPLRNR